MFRALMCATLLAAMACGNDEPRTSPEAPPEPASKPAPQPAPTPAAPPPPADDGRAEVIRRVVRDVGSKALGSQTIDPGCVVVALVPTGDWTIAAAHLEGCGDKTARSIVWLYKRQGAGTWNEDYVGQPPKCWKHVPPDIARAVAIATKIKTC